MIWLLYLVCAGTVSRSLRGSKIMHLIRTCYGVSLLVQLISSTGFCYLQHTSEELIVWRGQWGKIKKSLNVNLLFARFVLTIDNHVSADRQADHYVENIRLLYVQIIGTDRQTNNFGDASYISSFTYPKPIE